jgi:diguanylate cyclase (GGDEF)-like protein
MLLTILLVGGLVRLADVFSISTLMICTCTVTFVVAVSLTLTWMQDPGQRAVGLWCAALWVGTASALLLGLRTVLPFALSIGVGNMLGAGAYALMWLGCRAFDGRKRYWAAAAAGPAIWVVMLSCLPAVHSDVNQRIVVMSLLIGIYSGAASWEMFSGRRTERLPSRDLAVAFFSSHAIVYLARIPLTFLVPTGYVRGSGYSDWYALITFELFVHTMASAIILLMLIKDRAETRYRTASERDPLTGVYNRRFFVERVARMIAAGRSGVMMVLDIDHFKRVNDDHGHLAGDRVLFDFADRINGEIGDRAVFCRFGGEEFALYAAALDLDAGLELAEAIRRRVGALDIRHMDRRIGVTVSIGVVAVEQVVADFDALLGAADLALYEAKRSGRDRVVAYDPVLHLNRIAEAGRETDADEQAQPISAAG